MDWRGRSYFADFAYRLKLFTLLIEIKGFATHVTDMDRTRFSSELSRELFLNTLGFRIASFSYDDVAHRPEICITLLRALLNRYQSKEQPLEIARFAETEVIRLALSLARPLRPIDVTNHFSINHRTAMRILQSLCSQRWLRPIRPENSVRIVEYALVQGAWDFII